MMVTAPLLISQECQNARASFLARACGHLAKLSTSLLLVLLIACGRTASTNVPPAGTIWFGTSFDPSSMELAGRKTAVGSTEAFSMVAHLTKTMNATDLVIRSYFDGQLVGQSPVSAQGSGEVWGFSPGPLSAVGTWRYDITDVGGNVLASGSLDAR